VFERGYKAHSYVRTADGFLLGNRPLRPATLIWGKAKRLRDEVLSVRREAM